MFVGRISKTEMVSRACIVLGIACALATLVIQFLNVADWHVPILSNTEYVTYLRMILLGCTICYCLFQTREKGTISVSVLRFFLVYSIVISILPGHSRQWLPATCWFCVCILGAGFVERYPIERLLKLLWFMFALFTALFFYNYIFRDNAGKFARNLVYYLVACVPLALLAKKWYMRIIPISIVLIAVIITMKRAALLGILLALAAYMFFRLKLYSQTKDKTQRNVIAILLAIAVAVVVFILLYESSEDTILKRMTLEELQGGSGRFAIYKRILELVFGYFTLPRQLLGGGYNAVYTENFIGTSAHNDYLEILYDYGIIGIVCTIILLVDLFRIARRLLKARNPMGPAFGASVVLFLMLTSFSHLILYPTYFFFFILFWACGYREYLLLKEGDESEGGNRNLSHSCKLRRTAPVLRNKHPLDGSRSQRTGH